MNKDSPGQGANIVRAEKNRKQLAGQRFGRLTVISLVAGCSGRAKWNCLCDCGNSKVISTWRLTDGTSSCGCISREIVSKLNATDISGRRFGKLIAVNRVESGGTKPVWVCRCDCGSEVSVIRSNLMTGNTVSCGCAFKAERGIYTTSEKRKTTASYQASRRGRVKGGGGTFSRQQIDDLFKLQKGKCANCRTSIDEGFHRDHKTPLVMGGTNDISNIELLCPTCNLKKNAKDPIAWANENGRII